MPDAGISLDDAVTWWSAVWENYANHSFFAEYKRKKGKEWADEDLKTLLRFLTRKNENGSGQYKWLQKVLIPGRSLQPTVD